MKSPSPDDARYEIADAGDGFGITEERCVKLGYDTDECLATEHRGVDILAPRQWMLARQREHQGLAIDFKTADARRIFARRAHKAGIKLVAQDCADLRDRHKLAHRDIDRRIGLLERADPASQ